LRSIGSASATRTSFHRERATNHRERSPNLDSRPAARLRDPETFILTVRNAAATACAAGTTSTNAHAGHPERDARRLSDDEVRRLCASATDRYRPIITLLAWTGLRVSEALALKWDNISFDEHELHVTHQLDEGGKLKSPKTRAGKRTVPLVETLEQTLREHRKSQLALGFASADHFVFTTATGKPLNRHNVRNQGITVAAKKAALNGVGQTTITTHDLRRTFISHLILRLGLDPVRVSRIAGHSNVSVTLNTYADEFDKAMHRDDLMSRIATAGFGSV
jgi:integrase